MKKTFILFFVTAIIASSCVETTDLNPTKPITPRDYLTTGEWVTTALSWQGLDLFSSSPACEKDDKLIYIWYGDVLEDKTDSLCVDKNNIKISPQDYKVIRYTWTLSDDFKKLTHTNVLDKQNKQVFDIVELTEKKMILNAGDTIRWEFAKK